MFKLASKSINRESIVFADRTATQHDRLLAPWCHLSVGPSVCHMWRSRSV